MSYKNWNKKMRQEKKDKLITWAVFLPILALVIVFVYGFIGWNAVVSLTDWMSLKPTYNFVGLKHYAELFSNPTFITAFKNQLVLILGFVPATLLVGLGLAILLDQKIRAEGGFRTIYMLPFALSYVVTAVFWSWMFNVNVGAINTLLSKIGLGSLGIDWIGDPDVVLFSIIIALVWQFSGYTMLIFLAGIKSLPQSQIYAARVGGASGFDLYRRVVIPQLKGSFLSAFVILMIFGLKAFDFIWVLTSGGPGTSSYVLAVQMYKTTFWKSQFALGAAIATILFLLVLLIAIPYLYITYREE